MRIFGPYKAYDNARILMCYIKRHPLCQTQGLQYRYPIFTTTVIIVSGKCALIREEVVTNVFCRWAAWAFLQTEHLSVNIIVLLTTHWKSTWFSQIVGFSNKKK
jgi:hypothetical protein